MDPERRKEIVHRCAQDVLGMNRKRSLSLDSIEQGPRKKPTTRGRQPGAQGYPVEQLEMLNDIVARILPIGRDSWEEVARELNAHSTRVGWPMRTFSALRDRFNKVCAAHLKLLYADIDIMQDGEREKANRERRDGASHSARKGDQRAGREEGQPGAAE